MRILKKIFSKSRSLEDGIFFDAIQPILGFSPITLEFYKKAFTHRSSNRLDLKGNPINYERLGISWGCNAKLCYCSLSF